jgi:hypothetical protein
MLVRLFCLLILCFPSIVYGQCANGQCVQFTAPSKTETLFHGWYQEGDGKASLYWRGEKCGTFDTATGLWVTSGKASPIDLTGMFGVKIANVPAPPKPPLPKECICEKDKCECVKCPDGCVAVKAYGDAEPVIDYGMQWKPSRERCSISGREAGKKECYQFLANASANVPDDSSLRRLVVIGSANARKMVMDDLDHSNLLAPWKSKLIAQDYAPDHWHVADVGYKQYGDPTIYLVDAGGKVLHRQNDYVGGPQRLASALRKADASYDPSKDIDLSKAEPIPVKPDPVKPDPKPIEPLTISWQWLAAIVAAIAAFFIGRKR